jgi:hypothetical protein
MRGKYNTSEGESFPKQDIWTFLSKNALHAQVWHKNADITGRAFVANDDRPVREVHLDTSINEKNGVLTLRIAYKTWLERPTVARDSLKLVAIIVTVRTGVAIYPTPPLMIFSNHKTNIKQITDPQTRVFMSKGEYRFWFSLVLVASLSVAVGVITVLCVYELDNQTPMPPLMNLL